MSETVYVLSSEEMAQRMRMALAEVGITNPGAVTHHPDKDGIFFDPLAVDQETAWRAGEVSGAARPFCLACLRASPRTAPKAPYRERCEAYLPFTQDCGMERTP